MRRRNEDIWGTKRITDWFNDAERPEGMNRRGADYFYQIKDIKQKFIRNNIILYFLITRYGMGDDLRSMLHSSKEQGKLMHKALKELKGDGEHPGYAVTQQWDAVFQKDIAKFKKRADYVFRIIEENVKLTELYPYFQTIGFERLVDFGAKYAGGDTEQADQLQREIEEWNADHQEEIKAHMEEVAPLIAARDAHRQKVIEDTKAERRSRRIARQLETAEAREIRENAKRRQKEERRANRMFARYWS